MIELKRKSQMPIERAEMPLKGVVAQKAGEYLPNTKPALKRQQMPFKSIDGKRDYRAMFADLYKFHEKHNPPELDLTGEPGGYWWSASVELTELANKYGNDEYMNALLLAVFSELEREYRHLKAAGEKVL